MADETPHTQAELDAMADVPQDRLPPAARKIAGLLKADQLLDDLLEYVDVSLDLVRLDVRESLGNAIGMVIQVVVSLVLVSLIVIFASFAAAYYLNVVLRSGYLGFVLVTAFYSLLFLGYFAFFKAPIQRKIKEGLSKSIRIKSLEKDGTND